MFTTQQTSHAVQWLKSVLALGLTAASLAYAQAPAEIPLLPKTGTAVLPNILLTLDDSGSMAFRHMPETVFASDTFTTTNPVQSNTVRWDLTDNYQTGTNFAGTVAGNIASTNYALRALRSSDTNSIYYNPQIRYQPWLTDDGVTRRPNASVTAAYISPPLKATTATSATSLTVATGTKVFVLDQAGMGFVNTDPVVITSTASPATTWMVGTVTSLSGTTLTVNVTSKLGLGTVGPWNIVKSTPIDLTNITPTGTFTAGSFIVGKDYTIVTHGTTSFTAIGAANNNPGTSFTATGVGSGTGTASGSGNLGAGWCFANTGLSGTGTGAGQGCQAPTVAFNHDPGVYFTLGMTVSSAASLAANQTYTIVSTGTTNFIAIGAADNNPGTVFKATGPGSGTGTAGVYTALTAYANYTAYSINDVPATMYPSTGTKSADRVDCAGTRCTRDEERQNFANWYSYYRDRNLMARGSLMEAFGPLGTVFRLGFGRINKGTGTVDGVSTKVIESSATYNGGGVRDYTPTRRIDLFKWLEDMPASGGTILTEALEASGEYYKRQDTKGPWTDVPGSAANTVANNKTCRRSYTILTTDGYWNGQGTVLGNIDGTNWGGAPITASGASYSYVATHPYTDASSNTLADVAMYYWYQDLQPGMANAVTPTGHNPSFWQNMTTFTVGLGVRGTLNPATDLPALTAGTKTWPPAGYNQTVNNVDDLWHAAINGHGDYFSVKDPSALAYAIKTILTTATGAAEATAGVATAAVVLQANNFKYVPKYTPGTWNGDVDALKLDQNGQIGAQVWNAAAKMPAFSARNVVTWDTGQVPPVGVPFVWGNISATGHAAMGTVATTYTTQFIDFIKGDHSNEGGGQPFRARVDTLGSPFILGDIVNANPVLVLDNYVGPYASLGLGSGSGSDPTYAQFQVNKKARTAVLFTGANDGMLHAFKDSQGVTPATDGTEIFAYVPGTIYPNLYMLADQSYGTPTLPHQFFVDGPLQETDAYVMAPGAGTASWRNYLIGSLGAGGRGIFALDVTDSANLNSSTVRWEINNNNDTDLGYILQPVSAGVLPNGRWVAIFGNGFSSTNGYATLFVVDIENAASSNMATRAAAIQKLNVDTSGSNGLGGVTLVHNANGQVISLYGGDLKGKMWKFVYNAATPGTHFSATALFAAADAANNPQPITSSPAVYNNSLGGYMVIFGTGKLFTVADSSDTSAQTIYSVYDKPSETMTLPLGRAALESRALSSFAGPGGETFYGLTGNPVNYVTQRGWYIDVATAIPGGRTIYPAQAATFDTALISVVAPYQGVPQPCTSGDGKGIDFLLPVESGALSTTHPNFDTNGDGVVNSSDTAAAGYSTAADGIDAVVTSNGASTTSQGDCTGPTCGGLDCPSSIQCPDTDSCGNHLKCFDSIQASLTGNSGCFPRNPTYIPTCGGSSNRTYDRVWQRILTPPIK